MVIKTTFLCRLFTTVTMVAFLIAVMPAKSEAYIISTAEVVGLSSDRQADIEVVRSVLENKAVKEKFLSLGYSEGEVNGKLAKLSDEELHDLALNIDKTTDGKGVAGVLIGLLVILVIVVIILEITQNKIVIDNR